MKTRTLLILLTLIPICGCQTNHDAADIILEDGVEVVLNSPGRQGGGEILKLKELYAVDTEDKETAEMGLTDIGALGASFFAVDSQGGLIICNPKNKKPIFFVFDGGGQFLNSFGQIGEGPGEFQAGLFFRVCPEENEDRLAVFDSRNNKMVVLRLNGELMREIKLDSNIDTGFPLLNGNYLLGKRTLDGSDEFLVKFPLVLVDSDLADIKQLDRQTIPNPMIGERLKGIYYIFSWEVSRDWIFTGFQDRDYDIWVYDFAGNLVRKVRKDSKGVPFSEEHKQKFLKQFDSPQFADIRKKIFFPDNMPAYHSFFCDEVGRLYVSTYESGPRPGEYMVDVFNSRGIWKGNFAMKRFQDEYSISAGVRDGRLYLAEEKENGYKRLAVYQMDWRVDPD